MRPGLLCPGKFGERCHTWFPPSCFNEAGAVMPRKACKVISSFLDLIIASMRPGLLCPGKP